MDASRIRSMEDEMSRFLSEISSQQMMDGYGPTSVNGIGRVNPSPQPPMLIPHQIQRGPRRYKAYPKPVSKATPQPAVLSAKPTLYAPPRVKTTATTQSMDFVTLQCEVEQRLEQLKNMKVAAEVAISQGKASNALQSFGPEDYKRKGGPKNRKLMRVAGGQTWEDNSLADWPDHDFRIFCGDLGDDVTDDLLTRTFNKFPSFQRAKVIRDKRTNKSKGYGFVSFMEPADFTKAMKEINGRYVGSRPIKLRKSTWRNRCIDVVKKKKKERAALVHLLTSATNK